MTDDGTLLAFYGDDFTGSTDVLESLALAGVETVLFLETPAAEDLRGRFGDAEAVGVAGTSRSMSPAEMDETLPDTFEALAEFDPTLAHYKVCSTFDSSPDVGSVGHALDIGQAVFDSPFVPLVVAAPSLEPRGRYVVFGNLFATVDGATYRLDRHPTMSEHPVTPMKESDVRRHLGGQTDRDVGLVDVRQLNRGVEAAEAAFEETRANEDVVLFDGVTRDHQRRVGRLVWEQCEGRDEPLFAVGSSGLEYALTGHLRAVGRLDGPVASADDPDPVDRLVVMSGSVSPVNAGQIEWALDNGFDGVRLDAAALVDPDEADDERERAVAAAADVLADGGSPLLYSARGPDDPAVEKTAERVAALGGDRDEAGRLLGREQGRITRRLLDASDVSRLCVAGGDTSGHVGRELDMFALEFLARAGPGSPLCLAHSHADRFDGLEVALKGGQVQTTSDDADYFGVVRAGGRNT